MVTISCEVNDTQATVPRATKGTYRVRSQRGKVEHVSEEKRTESLRWVCRGWNRRVSGEREERGSFGRKQRDTTEIKRHLRSNMNT